MPQAAPATRFNELVDRLAIVASNATLDEMELQRISRGARESLMSADAAAAHTLLGAVAALHGDEADCERHHGIALSLRRDSITEYNYVISLSHLGKYKEGFQVSSAALERHTADRDLLSMAFKLGVQSASFTKARALVDRFDTILPDDMRRFANTVRRLAAAIDAGVFHEAAVGTVLDMLASIQRQAGVRSIEFRLGTDNADPDRYAYEAVVFATPKDAAALNEQFADTMAGRPDLLSDPGLRFVAAFVPAVHRVRYT